MKKFIVVLLFFVLVNVGYTQQNAHVHFLPKSLAYRQVGIVSKAQRDNVQIVSEDFYHIEFNYLGDNYKMTYLTFQALYIQKNDGAIDLYQATDFHDYYFAQTL